jgi:hypothetical protein
VNHVNTIVFTSNYGHPYPRTDITINQEVTGLRADYRLLQHVGTQIERRLLNSTVIKDEEPSCILFPIMMSCILSMMICIGMIVLDNLLQCLICIVMTDLSGTCDSTNHYYKNAL